MKKCLFIVLGLLLASALSSKEKSCFIKDGKKIWADTSYSYMDYDSEGNLVHTKDDEGTEEWYDTRENLIHCKSGDGFEYWQEFDEKDNMISSRTSRGEVWTGVYKYDKNGNAVYCKDSDGTETWCKYGKKGKKISVKTNRNKSKTYVYDKNGNVIHYSLKEGKELCETTFEYDDKNRVIKIDSNIGLSYSMEYDDKGNVSKCRYNNGLDEFYEYEYNDKNQVIKKTAYRPVIVYTNCNLRLRKGEDTSTEIITVMPQNTKLYISEIGNREVIDGIVSNWVKVIPGNGEKEPAEGWCFGGYLTGSYDFGNWSKK